MRANEKELLHYLKKHCPGRENAISGKQVMQKFFFFCSRDVLLRAALPKKGAKKQGPLSPSGKRPLFHH